MAKTRTVATESVHSGYSALTSNWRDVGGREHFAQIYEDDEELVDVAGAYAAANIAAGAAVVLIAAPSHLEGIRTHLLAEGSNLDLLVTSGQLVFLDASEALEQIAPGSIPQKELFDALIGPIVANALVSYGQVAAFGEMVNLLWKAGHVDSAIRLEEFWNDLATRYPFKLFCAYHLQTCGAESHVVPFEAVCKSHSRVIPSENYLRRQGSDHLHTIARLQQKAYTLERSLAERKSAEENEALLAAIVASSDDAVVSKSLDGVIRSWNAGAERIFGYASDEVVGKPITIIIPSELLGEEGDILAKISRGERIEHFETIRVTKDGRRIPISLSVSPVRNVAGEIIGASKIARDISERKRSEEALAAARQAAATDAAALARLNEHSTKLWHCRTLNEGLEQMLDAVIELLGADFGHAQLCKDGVLRIVAQRGFQDDFLRAFAGLSAEDGAACARAPRSGAREIVEDVEDDREFAPLLSIARSAGYRSVVSTPLVGSDGTVLGVLSAHFRNVHRPNEAELRRLDLYVRQAADFVQRCQIEDTLREADRRKNEFLATLAHELRNPLAPIRFAATTFQLAQASPQQRQAAQIIERQVAHMGRLLDDLLEVSRISHGTIVLQRDVVELMEIISTAVETSRPTLDAKKHQLTLDLPSFSMKLHADAVRLAQVFSNLLINAAKYTPAGGQIFLHAWREQDWVVVTVRDTGIGISREMVPKLFTLFAQARSALPHSEGGLGIGLALVKGLLTLHGGSIDVASEGAGKGSVFTVRLPLDVPRKGNDLTTLSKSIGTSD